MTRYGPVVERIRRALLHPGTPPEEPEEPFTRAAVALVWAAPGDLLMIKRAEHEGDPWSGHMAFPGGRVDPGDATPLAAAIRESREELALDLSAAEVVGELTPIRTPFRARGHVHYVHAHVFLTGAVGDLAPNREVASVHRFALERLLANEGRDSFEWRGWTMPCVRLDGCFIWGMSLRLIDELLERIRAE